ncbi:MULTISPECIES: hypothetical protein [unclassified Rhodococcus (in: high G+C Gram-positive bacteria)]|uniref:hypothetical protein n=1 Tax=unclassified Rhodococcus (in: high G+C Gram-positive bacteria) TaxID=192944 RepID=UPI00051A00F0|nr:MULTISPECIES: hypothetical protein [unclassified Rhodococcus (in: high G+C Gram-positive bacteria)]AOD23257.1 hypothetical protein IM25_18075 [Rhodococcus sp. p52]KHJ71232.1 hypothetical protein QR64_19025 [Rhodococcus sp. Chr-9]
MATSTHRSLSTCAAAAAATTLQAALNLALLGVAAFGLGVAGLAARSFPVPWSGFAVPAVFVVLAVIAATPWFDPPPGRWRTGYTAVAAICVVATPWMPAAVQVAGALTVLGVGFAIIGLSEHLPAVRNAGLSAIVIGALSSSDLGRGWLPLAETGTYHLVPALVTALVGVCAAAVGVGLLLRRRGGFL